MDFVFTYAKKQKITVILPYYLQNKKVLVTLNSCTEFIEV